MFAPPGQVSTAGAGGGIQGKGGVAPLCPVPAQALGDLETSSVLVREGRRGVDGCPGSLCPAPGERVRSGTHGLEEAPMSAPFLGDAASRTRE